MFEFEVLFMFKLNFYVHACGRLAKAMREEKEGTEAKQRVV